MIPALNIASGNLIDAEYLWIIQELRRFGIAPTGNKNADMAKLEQVKSQLISKLQKRETEEYKQNMQVQTLEPVDEAEIAKKAEMEVQRLGAMALAEYNKNYHGL